MSGVTGFPLKLQFTGGFLETAFLWRSQKGSGKTLILKSERVKPIAAKHQVPQVNLLPVDVAVRYSHFEEKRIDAKYKADELLQYEANPKSNTGQAAIMLSAFSNIHRKVVRVRDDLGVWCS